MAGSAPYPGPEPGPYQAGSGGPYYRGYGARYGPPGRRRLGLRWVFVGLAAVILALGVLLLLLSAYPSAFGFHREAFFPFGGGFLGVILLLWGAVLLVRVAVWSSRRRGPYAGMGGARFDPAIMAARQRYARGEITQEQFHQIVSDLRRPPGPLP